MKPNHNFYDVPEFVFSEPYVPFSGIETMDKK